MSKKYISSVNRRAAVPRSSRRRNQISAATTIVQSRDSSTTADPSIIEKIGQLMSLLDWFGFDEETQQIRAKFGLYTYNNLTAGGKGVLGNIRLDDHGDVVINDPRQGQVLVYDSKTQKWTNRTLEHTSGGSASLESDITAGVSVGFVSKGRIFPQGATLTQIMQMIFSQDIMTILPSVTLTGVPLKAIEIGSAISLELGVKYTDGMFINTGDGNIPALCTQGIPLFYVDGIEVTSPYTYTALSAKEHTIEVSLPYETSQAEVTNLSGEIVDKSIPAGTAQAQGVFIVGYKYFWGYMVDDAAENLTSNSIRSLVHQNIINPNGQTVTLLDAENVVPGGEDLIIAVPEGYVLSEVIDKTTSQDFSLTFESKSIVVSCAGAVKKNYTVYRCDNLTDSPMYITKIAIKKEA